VKKGLIIILGIVVLISGILYTNRGKIILSLAEGKAVEYAEYFCDSHEIINKLGEIASDVTSQWETLTEEDQVFFATCLKRIKSARAYKALGSSDDEELSDTDFQAMLDEAESRLSDYED